MAEPKRSTRGRRITGYRLFLLFFAVFVLWVQLTQLNEVCRIILPLDVIQGNPSFQKLASLLIQGDSPTIAGEHETSTIATRKTDAEVTSDTATAAAAKDDKPKGVFVIKTIFAKEVLRTVCILDRFFNREPKYAIRIFADEPVSEATLEEFKKINPAVDLEVIVDQRWKELPKELSPAEREEMEVSCTVDSCTVHNITMGYVYMGYWRYQQMAYEESLKDFDYFITIDGDGYLTRPWDTDPFQLMQDNNLTGFYVTDFHNYGFDQGIEETTYAVFGTSTEGRGYLNSPETFPFFDDGGKMNHRSLYGYFFGGRLDFFRLPYFREFSRRMVPFTYRYRVDEQVVIARAWSMMEPDRVWHLPTRGYRMGIYHHSVVDHEQLINCYAQLPPDGATVFNDTTKEFCYWSNPGLPGGMPLHFQFPGGYGNEPHWVNYNDLVRQLLASRGGDDMTAVESSWDECYCQPTKEGSYFENQVLDSRCQGRE